VGFDDGRAYTLAETAALIDFLKHDRTYGGNTVMLGVPTWWREQTADATSDRDFHAVLEKADLVSPWTPGRYYDLGGVRAHAERFWVPDRAWCRAHGLEYMPVVFPGFSWRNLKGTRGGIDRLDGRFLWEQYRSLVEGGFTMVYQAMFDEMDEGTQIFKTATRPPRGTNALSYAPLPSDYYLWLVGEAADHVRRAQPLPAVIPDRAGHAADNAFLRANDQRVYRAVAASFDAQRAFFRIGDALRTTNGGWAPYGGTARVRAAGKWFPRHLWSDDPGATVEWQMRVPEAGPQDVSIRYPGDPNQDHATAARLGIQQAGRTVAEYRVNLRRHTLDWNVLGQVSLRADEPCTFVLDQPVKTGALMLFEPRLAPK
ncbi:MAG TPA: hypothetical protein VHB50_18560, partial [Bryobacteraceae bacterium]|nr:hypothetical protein [Bryobacteraceae bacterium]